MATVEVTRKQAKALLQRDGVSLGTLKRNRFMLIVNGEHFTKVNAMLAYNMNKYYVVWDQDKGRNPLEKVYGVA